MNILTHLGDNDMLILDYPDWTQSTLSLQLIPKAAYEMTPVLSAVDKLLDDEIYEEPIIKRFKTLRGRPTVPVRVYYNAPIN